MKDKENRDSVEFDRLHEKDYSDKLIYGQSTLTKFEKAFIGETNHTMAFGIPIKPKRYLNKVGRSEEQSHYDYIGAPGGEEGLIPNTWEVDAGVYGTIRGINLDYTKYHLNELIQNGMIDLKEFVRQLFDVDCSKLSNVNINKGQGDMFSYTNISPAATTEIQEDEFIKAHKKLVQKEKAKRAGTYRPLPDCITIKESSIDGLGVFATEDIRKLVWRDPNVWKTHTLLVYNDYNFFKVEELLRTAIGSFINHSNNPNCTLEKSYGITADEFVIGKYFLQPLRDIKAGEELVLDYRVELKDLSGYDGAEFLKK